MPCKTKPLSAANPETGDTAMLRVGSKVWVFDENSRVYGPGPRGKPIYRAHWREVEISGETRDSWILGSRYGKVPKKRDRPDSWLTRPDRYVGTRHRVAVTQAEVDDSVWVEENRYRIQNEVARCSEAATLRKIDELLQTGKATR